MLGNVATEVKCCELLVVSFQLQTSLNGSFFVGNIRRSNSLFLLLLLLLLIRDL